MLVSVVNRSSAAPVVLRLPGLEQVPTSLRFETADELIVALSADGTPSRRGWASRRRSGILDVGDLSNGTIVASIELPTDAPRITAMSFAPGGQRLTLGDEDGRVLVADLETENLSQEAFATSGTQILWLDYFDRGRLFFAVDVSGEIRVSGHRHRRAILARVLHASVSESSALLNTDWKSVVVGHHSRGRPSRSGTSTSTRGRTSRVPAPAATSREPSGPGTYRPTSRTARPARSSRRSPEATSRDGVPFADVGEESVPLVPRTDWRMLCAPVGLDERALRAACRRRRFARGETVFHEGDPAGAFHLLEIGHVAIRLTTPLGDVAIIDVLEPGDTFGEQALVEGPNAAQRSPPSIGSRRWRWTRRASSACVPTIQASTASSS